MKENFLQVRQYYFQLRNIPENVTFLDYLPSSDLKYFDNNSRINYHLFVLIGDIYNFKIHIRLAESFAYVDSSGSWHGAIKLITRRKVNFCMTALRWENDRYGLVEHTTHSYHAQYKKLWK